MNGRIKEAAQKEMNKRMPYKELDYRNAIVATAIAKGKAAMLTADWVMRSLLTDVEDEFMTYGQAVAIKDKYLQAIEEVKALF